MDVLEAIEHAESDLATTLDELRITRELLAALEQDANRIRSRDCRPEVLRQTPRAVGRPRTQRRRRSDLQPQSGSWRAAGPDLGLMSRSDAVSDGDARPARSGGPQPDS